MSDNDTFPSPVVAAFLRGFADYAEQRDFGKYHPPEPEMTFDRPPFTLTPQQLKKAKDRSAHVKAMHHALYVAQ